MERKLQTAVFAAGCFWCTEAVFQRIKGVSSVKSGYTGGHIKNPAYREVCQGRTGHAEGILFKYDPEVVTYKELLEIFFATHDPTTLNRQGNDRGTQYRSAIFFTDSQQQKEAQEFVALLEEQRVFDDPIVTEVQPLDVFYEAEADHDAYYDRNREQMYCQYIIDPKIKKINTYYKEKLKATL